MVRFNVFVQISVAFVFLAIATGSISKVEDRRLHWPHRPHRPHCPHWPHWPHHPCHKTTTSAPTSTAAPTTRPPHCPPWPLPCHHTTTSAPTSTSAPSSRPPHCPPWPLPCHQTTTSTTATPSTNQPTEPSSTTSAPTSTSENPSTSRPVDTSHQWVLRDAGTLPLGCSFIYGGTASNRLLYVGRVNVSDQLVPAAIHHYSSAGNEYYTAIGDGEIVTGRESVEWLCSAYGVAWVRVKDFSDDVLGSLNPVVIGRNSETGAPTYACLTHSFYNNLYPPSVGQIVGNSCQFAVGNEIVDTSNFNWWHTLELLVSLGRT